MRLGTRLFLFVAVLLLLISLAVYLVPIYLVRRHNQEDRKRYLAEVEEERAHAQARYSDWISEEVATREASINAFLYLIAGHSEIQGRLLSEGKVTESVWLRSSKLLSYSDELTFLEVQEQGKSAAITLSRTRLYLSKGFTIKDDLSWIAVGSVQEPKDERLYLGIWLSSPKIESDEPEVVAGGVPEIFLLFDPIVVYHKGTEYVDRLHSFDEWVKGAGRKSPQLAQDLSKALFTHLEEARQHLIKHFGDPNPANTQRLKRFLSTFDHNLPQPLAKPGPVWLPSMVMGLHVKGFSTDAWTHNEMPKTAEFYTTALLNEIRRINDLELITALGYLSSEGAIYQGPFDRDAPAGAARLVSKKKEGTAVLSSQAFSAKELFDGPAHIEQFPPTKDGPPIATQFGLLDRQEAGALTVVNVLALGSKKSTTGTTYLTLGTSLEPVLARLAQISGETSFLIHNNHVVGEAEMPSVSLSAAERTAFANQVAQLGERGFIDLDGTKFYYMAYYPNPNWDAAFVTLELGKTLTSPIQQFEERSKQLSLQVSHHIIVVAVGVFIVALLILEILTRHFTQPIRKLAVATQKVAEGKYDAVKLPKAPARSKNEVMILTRSFGSMIQHLRDREKLRSVLNKVVSKEIADEILKGRIHLGGEVREVTVLFADIRGFSSITEHLPPDEVIVFINSYMTVMTEVIEAYQGVIDKYVGDEVMALFGAPLAHPHSSLQAVLAALVMCERMREWNRQREAHGIVTADVGIGIHTGQMVAGNMGAEDRLNYTVMGANVNLASRLCQDAEASEILIAEQMLVLPGLADTLEVEEKTAKTFKGFSKPIKVYRVLGLKPGVNLERLSEFVRQFDSDQAPPWDAGL